MATSSRKRKRTSASQGASSADEGDFRDYSRYPKLQHGDFICPICLEILSEVYITTCGHSFCYKCITQRLSQTLNCPVCKSNLPPQNSILPNFSFNSLVTKYRQQQASIKAKAKTSPKVEEIAGLVSKVDNKDHSELLSLFEAFRQGWKEQAENEDRHVLLDFLESAAKQKIRELEAIKAQCQVLQSDIETVKANGLSKPKPGDIERKTSRVHSNFHEVLEDYIGVRMPYAAAEETVQEEKLQTFSETLKSFTCYSSWRELSSLSYGDPITPSSIVSSIEFDRDGEVFAVAGVTKKIKVFSYASVLKNVGFQNHYPSSEMECEAKLSCVSFNPYHKTTLASADYEGCVNVWDVYTALKKMSHHEHNKRVWSVVYNPMEPKLYASGSDDSTVKMWSANCKQSIFTLETKANVCSVQFHPTNCYYLAFGSADHSIHYMDMRKPHMPLHLLKGHRKAVSYVQFISTSELVSASTDSQLKLWSIDNGQCQRTYKGHVNEKNFIGLSVSNGYIACGSENNSVYVYCKQISTPMLTYRFSSASLLSTGDQDNADSNNDFVSSVCWRKEQDIILAANSQGHIKVLEMC